MKTILLLLTITLGAFAQDCVHTNLSKDFDFKVYAKWYGSAEHTVSDSLDVKIEIISKKTKAGQQIHFGSAWMFEGTYTNCKYVRSYSTGFNKDSLYTDNDYGDIVVADFNFDGLDDVAFKQNGGGNGGPSYYYYIQDKKGKFIQHDFLTATMGYFPAEFVPLKKRLITRVHANAYQYSETTYQYDASAMKWKILKSELKDWD